jgi:hypothetical protein
MRKRWLLLAAAAVATTALVNATGSGARSMTVVPTTTVYAWIGLKNSDDVGTRFDVRAEVTRGALSGYGYALNQSGGSSGFNNAKPVTIPVSNYIGTTTEGVSVRISVRVACQSGHASGTARLWWNDLQANSRVQDSGFGTLWLTGTNTLGPAVGPGPKKTSDLFVKKSCPQDANANWQTLGTWSTGKLAQTITFTSSAPVLDSFFGDSYTPVATATSGLPVSFSLDGSSAGCSLSGGTVYADFGLFENATCVINANQAGDSLWAAAPQVQQNVLIVGDPCAQQICTECNDTDPDPGGPVCGGRSARVDSYQPLRQGLLH